MLLANGAQPNELVMKRLAMMGCVGLVLAHRWGGEGLLLPIGRREEKRRAGVPLLQPTRTEVFFAPSPSPALHLPAPPPRLPACLTAA